MITRSRRRNLYPCLLLAVLTACDSSAPDSDIEEPNSNSAGTQIDPFYARFRHPRIFGHEAEYRASLPIESITLDSQGSEFGPDYEMVLHKDGRAQFLGRDHVGPLIGKHRGIVHLEDYAQLCMFTEHLRFDELSPDYSSAGSHGHTMTIRIKYVGTEEPVEVSDYSEYGPPDFLLLVLALEAEIRDIDWEPL